MVEFDYKDFYENLGILHRIRLKHHNKTMLLKKTLTHCKCH